MLMLILNLAEVPAEKFIVVQKVGVYGLKKHESAVVLNCCCCGLATSGPTAAKLYCTVHEPLLLCRAPNMVHLMGIGGGSTASLYRINRYTVVALARLIKAFNSRPAREMPPGACCMRSTISFTVLIPNRSSRAVRRLL